MLRYIYEFIVIFIFKKNFVPVRYFSAKKNVGDAINVYLITKLTNRNIFEVKVLSTPHILGVGSIIHLGSSKSLVWGSGLIKESIEIDSKTLMDMKFLAVRGSKTQEIIAKKTGRVLACALGDPAVLMPNYYLPKTTKKYLFGIVPHYSDKKTGGVSALSKLESSKIIDVELSVEKFIDELNSCEIIISSSLHGLILADSYGIPNVWVRFSDNLIGGEFKFLDYYSTTNEQYRKPVDMTELNLSDVKTIPLVAIARVARFKEDKELLINCFPMNV